MKFSFLWCTIMMTYSFCHAEPNLLISREIKTLGYDHFCSCILAQICYGMVIVDLYTILCLQPWDSQIICAIFALLWRGLIISGLWAWMTTLLLYNRACAPNTPHFTLEIWFIYLLLKSEVIVMSRRSENVWPTNTLPIPILNKDKAAITVFSVSLLIGRAFLIQKM